LVLSGIATGVSWLAYSFGARLLHFSAQPLEIAKPYKRQRVGWRWLESTAVGWPRRQVRGQGSAETTVAYC
jgi:hypothetical protein